LCGQTISIIGSGRVGSAVALLCAASSLGDVVLVNRDEKKAIGQMYDLTNAIPAHSDVSITAASDYSQIAGSDLVVITASSGIHKKHRTELLHDNVSLVRSIIPNITKYASDAKILVITNPVDVIAYVIQKEGAIPPKNVIGISSELDSKRFRYLLAQKIGTHQSMISGAIVMGEHDDTMVPVFSHAKFSGKRVSEFLNAQQKQQITEDVRNYWQLFRDYGWYSVFGISKITFDVIDSILKNKAHDISASVFLDGQYGIRDVCIGVPITVDGSGIRQIRQITLNDEELEMLQASAIRVRDNVAKVS
jgi:malate dehydrogenase